MPSQEQAQPGQLFESIGSKVESITPGTDGSSTDDFTKPVEEIESLCMNCHEDGITRLLLTSIPYFREIIVTSFSCGHCGFRNSEIQPAGSIQPKGTYHELRPTVMADLSRQIIKSDTATVKFIELDLEVPAGRGQLTNVEGILSNIVEDLALNQEVRKEQAPEAYEKIQSIIERGRAMLAGDAFPFRICVDDPAGNSFITPDLKDGVGKWEKHEYARTSEQNLALGLAASNPTADLGRNEPGLTDDGEIIPDEVYTFPSTCPGCSHPCDTNMKMVDIPHFKQVVLMAVSCDDCGFRSNDVKTGGVIPDKAERITVSIRKGPTDLSRDILKSESCALECPEVGLSVNAGTLGGRFTTIEGLLTQIRDDLRGQVFEAHGTSRSPPAAAVAAVSTGSSGGGDSSVPEERQAWDEFFEKIERAINGEMEFTVVLSDPLASSFVQSLVDPPEVDPQIHREYYDRTEEEEEDLGLKDMKTEGYEQDETKEVAGDVEENK